MRSRSRVRREQKLTERVGSVHRDPVVEEGAGRHWISLDSSATWAAWRVSGVPALRCRL